MKSNRAKSVVGTIAWGVLQVSAALGVEEAPRLVDCPGSGRPVAARVDQRGIVHLVYDTSSGPKYSSSSDGGKSFSPSRNIVDPNASQPKLEFSVWDMAVGPQGQVHVALGTNAWKLKLPQEEWGFFYSRLEPGNASFEPVRNINRKPSEGFSLAADNSGRVTACWLSDRLHANVSHDGGKSFGANVEIDPRFDPCDCCATSITYGSDGRLAVLYREETDNHRDMFLVLWDQKSGQIVRTPVSTTKWIIDGCPMTYYTVVPSANGYLAVWPTRRQVCFARLDAHGSLLPPGEIATGGLSGMRTGVVSLTNPSGESLIAWNGDGKIGWQRFDAAGHPMGEPGTSSCSGKGMAGFVAADGSFVLLR